MTLDADGSCDFAMKDHAAHGEWTSTDDGIDIRWDKIDDKALDEVESDYAEWQATPPGIQSMIGELLVRHQILIMASQTTHLEVAPDGRELVGITPEPTASGPVSVWSRLKG